MQASTRIACAFTEKVISYECTSKLTLDRPLTSASAHLPGSSAIFSRSGNAAELRLDIRTPGVAAVFNRGNVEEAVISCCEQEIAFVRSEFEKIGALLINQLDDRGDRARIDDTVDWKENRSWKIGPSDFNVAGTRQHATSQIDVANAPSDAAIVREMIRLQLSGRILAIRDVYHQMLGDVRKPRRNLNSKKPF